MIQLRAGDKKREDADDRLNNCSQKFDIICLRWNNSAIGRRCERQQVEVRHERVADRRLPCGARALFPNQDTYANLR